MAHTPRPISATILLSHTHLDHIQGFLFFAPFFVPGNQITVCGPEGSGRSLRDVLSGQMEFTQFPVGIGELPATITFRELGAGTHEIGGARFMAGAGLVIHDAQYTPEEYLSKKNWGHSTYEYAVGLAAAAGVRQLALTHHDPTHDDAFVETTEKRARGYAEQLGYAVKVCCAYEGAYRQRSDLTVAHAMSAHRHHTVVAGQRHRVKVFPVFGLSVCWLHADGGARGTLARLEERPPGP